MDTRAQLPTVLARSGAQTKNPEPMIEASGVAVAFQREEFRKAGAKLSTKKTAGEMSKIRIFITK